MKKILLLSLLIAFFSCEKDQIMQETDDLDSNQQSRLKGYYVKPYDFDWENETFITYKGQNIFLPWTSGANSAAIPKEICDDFLKLSGWELLYNDFPFGQSDPKFMLYNKFTGIVKVFMYITTTTYQGNSFTWGFGANTTSCQTSTFNFNRKHPEPITKKYSHPSVYVANYSSDINAIPNGINAGHWYSSQFEVMYDPNIASLTHSDIDFRLQCFTTERKYITLSGTFDGNISGTFSMPNSGGNSGVFSDVASSFDINKIGKLSFPSLTQSKTFLTGYISKQTNSYLKSQLTSGLSKLASSLTSTNPILKVLTGGLFSTKASSPGKIDCSINARLNATGTITASFSGPGAIFKFPGTSNTNLGGLLPNYDKPLGVFCITAKPKINVVQYSTWIYESEIYSNRNTLDLDLSSFAVIINPELSASCSNITVYKNIVMYPHTHSPVTMNDAILIDSYNHLRYMSNQTYMEELYEYQDNSPIGEDDCKVRVTVFLTPNGQSDPIIIIKEFEPDLNHTFITLLNN